MPFITPNGCEVLHGGVPVLQRGVRVLQGNALTHNSPGQRPGSRPTCNEALKGRHKRHHPGWAAPSGLRFRSSATQGAALGWHGSGRWPERDHASISASPPLPLHPLHHPPRHATGPVLALDGGFDGQAASATENLCRNHHDANKKWPAWLVFVGSRLFSRHFPRWEQDKKVQCAMP